MTLRQLVSHSAGLTTSGFPGYRAGDELPTTVQILDGVGPANTFGVRVDTVPGTQFRYSGGGTLVMQQLLEDVTGTPFRELVRELVLEPLGMRRQRLRAAPAGGAPRPRRDGPRRGRPADRGALAHLPGARDRRPLDDARRPRHLRDRRAAGVRRGRRGSALARARPRAADAAGPGGGPHRRPRIARASGRSSAARAARAGSGTPGGNEGFRCHLLAYRDTGQGAAVMTNGDNGTWLVQATLAAIAAAFGWPDYPPELDRAGDARRRLYWRRARAPTASRAR